MTTPAPFAASPWIVADAAMIPRGGLPAEVDRTLAVALPTAGGKILPRGPLQAEDRARVGIAGALLAPVNHPRPRRFGLAASTWSQALLRQLAWQEGSRDRLCVPTAVAPARSQEKGTT